jgi:sugar/nucleoside kinase (ribokinase family)
MQRSPRIAVAGHLVADEIIYPGGEKISAPGGISYNLAGLLSVMEKGLIIPVCEIGYDMVEPFDNYFASHDIIDSSKIRKTPLPNVVNRLVYDSDGNREEWNSRIPENLSLDEVGDDIDAVLMNFISGDDFAVEDIARFKERYGGIIFCDYHSLSLGRDNEGKRFFRKHPEWERYLALMNIVQMNIAELATISGAEGLSFGNIIAVGSLIHNLGPEICIITLGRNGLVLSMEKGKSVYHIPPVTVRDEVDPTGCGDTLAAVFLYNYLLSGDPLQSAISGNRYAAAKVTFSGLDGFERMDTILESTGLGAEPVRIK